MRLPAGNELCLSARKHSDSPLLPIYRESLSGFKSWSELCTLFTDQSRDECSRHQRGFKGLFGFQQIRPCCLFFHFQLGSSAEGKNKVVIKLQEFVFTSFWIWKGVLKSMLSPYFRKKEITDKKTSNKLHYYNIFTGNFMFLSLVLMNEMNQHCQLLQERIHQWLL